MNGLVDGEKAEWLKHIAIEREVAAEAWEEIRSLVVLAKSLQEHVDDLEACFAKRFLGNDVAKGEQASRGR